MNQPAARGSGAISRQTREVAGAELGTTWNFFRVPYNVLYPLGALLQVRLYCLFSILSSLRVVCVCLHG
jgi:hypothetical protein